MSNKTKNLSYSNSQNDWINYKFNKKCCIKKSIKHILISRKSHMLEEGRLKNYNALVFKHLRPFSIKS